MSSLKIGNVRIETPFAQAALSGYSDWPMRVVARRLGASYTLCEVMLDQFLLTVKKRRKTQHFLYLSEDEHPVGGQLMGAEPEDFALGAARLAEAGFDVIDINFGCPVKKVLGRCRGGYHLSHPDVAIDIIRRTRDTVPPHIPVTVKMRRGMDDTVKSRDQFFEILDGAWAAGVSAVTVHGRTVAQGYTGSADWAFLRAVKQHSGSRIVFGSGDLFSASDCLAMMKQTGVDGVTIARGAIGNPWIFSQVRALAAGQPQPPPTLLAQREILQMHFDLAEQLYGPQRCGPLMRKFGIKYSALHPQQSQVRTAFTKVRHRHDWQAVLERWYAEDLPGRYPPPEVHRVQGERRSARPVTGADTGIRGES